MAGPPFEAGSILIALRASAENLQKEIQKANQTLQQFGAQVQGVAKATETASAKVVDGFNNIDRNTLKLTARIASFSQRLIGLQFVLQSFANTSAGSGDGLDKFREKTQGAVGALTTFAGIVSLFPNKIGLIVGAIAGLTIFIVDLVRQLNQASEAVKKVEQAAADIDKARQERLERQRQDEVRIAQLRLAGIQGVASAENRLNSNLENQKALTEEIVKLERARQTAIEARAKEEARIAEDIRRRPEIVIANQAGVQRFARDLRQELADNKEIARLTNESTKLGEQLGKAREELQKFNKEAEVLQKEVKIDENFEEASKTFDDFAKQSERVRVQLETGLVDPVEALSAQLTIARGQLEAFVKLGPDSGKFLRGVLVDARFGETVFQTLTRRVLELQSELEKVQLRRLSEAEFRKVVEGFRQIGTEAEKIGRDLGVGLVTPVQAVEARLNAAREALRAFLDATTDQQIQIAVEILGVDSAEEAVQQLTRSLREAEEAAAQIKIEEQQAETFRNFERTVASIPDSLGSIQARLDAGFITPLEAAQQRARALEEAIIRVQEAASKVEGPRLGEALEEASVEVDRLLSELEKDRKIIADVEIREDFQRTFAEPFSAAIGDAVSRGILEGQDAMEILAGVGENLFSNFLRQSIDTFQKGMTQALTSIAGAGGEILGGLFSGLVGLAGFFLSGRGDSSSSQSFQGVQGQIESTQAVRGIVAGPESVSIAAVGENLRRAMVGVEVRLDALIRVASQIRDGQGVGGTAAGTPFAGTVPTA